MNDKTGYTPIKMTSNARQVLTSIVMMTAGVLAGFRIGGVKSEVFQAIAHLFVGALIGAYAVGRDRVLLYLVIALSVIEVICAVAFRS